MKKALFGLLVGFVVALVQPVQAGSSFFKINAGYDFSFLGDVVNGTKATGKAAYDLFGGTETTSPSNSGIATGLEFGIMFDQNHGLSLDTSFVLGFESRTAVDGGPGFEQKVSPHMLGATLNYILALPLGPGNDLCFSLGGGWFHSITDVFYSPVSGESIAGALSGDAFGAVLGITESIQLGGGLSIDITAKGRWAAFDKVTAATLTATDDAFFPDGPYTMTMQDPDGDGQMNFFFAAEADVDGSAIKYAVIDMSGIEGLLSIKISL